MPPFLGGGEMIDRVDFAGTTFNSPPYRFEAGTPNIAGQIGLAAALRWLRQQDAQAVQEHERALLEHASERLAAIPGLRLIGQAAEKVPLLCFVIEGTHANDVALLLDQEGIAVRSGQHCAHPLLRQLGVGATVRASFALYNTRDEIERFATALERVRRMLV
jgi:cysteine desulfurase/selenocysteine lyase